MQVVQYLTLVSVDYNSTEYEVCYYILFYHTYDGNTVFTGPLVTSQCSSDNGIIGTNILEASQY